VSTYSYEYDEAYDESDLEAAFEDLEYDESRRGRRGRRGGRRGGRRVNVPQQPSRPPTTPGGVRREIEAGRRRDQQIARAVNETGEEVSSLESRVNKANRDLGRLKMLSLITLLLPRSLATQRIRAVDAGSPPSPRLEVVPAGTIDPNAIEVVTGGGQGTDILPLILFVMMSRDIGTPPGRQGAGGAGNDMLPIILLLALGPGLQGGGTQQAGQAGGGLNQNVLLLLLATGALGTT
jgi:hypothetical protein